MLKRILLAPVSSEKMDGRVVEIILYAGALAFLVIAMRALANTALREGEYLLGILLVLSVTLLMILMGMMISVLTELKMRREPPV